MKISKHGQAAPRSPHASLLEFFEARKGNWSPKSSHFARRDHRLTVAGLPWRVACGLHAQTNGGKAVLIKASVTLWPWRLDEQASRALLEGKWYGKVQRRLRRYGYRGRWRESPYGRFGDFWKTLSGVKAVPAEVEFLESVDWLSKEGVQGR